MTIRNQLSRLALFLAGAGLSGGFLLPCGAETPPILAVPSPLPPAIFNDANGPLTVPPPPQILSQSSSEERIFQRSESQPPDLIFRQGGAASLPAPVSEQASPSSAPSDGAIFYQVQVEGDSPHLLSQVKQIEPLAYVRKTDRTIQAGTFTQSHLARERLELLTQKGLEVRILPVTPEAGLAISHPSQLRYQIR